MAISASGLLLLLFIIFTGPIFYISRYFVRIYIYRTALSENGSDEDATSKQVVVDEDGEEKVDGTSSLLTLLGYAIGIGNVWRFPYLVGRYGGAAFVFAYLLMLFTCALPLFLLEMGLGQWTHKFFIETLEIIHPRWKGLGFAQAILIYLLISYYNVLIAYAIIYAFASVIDPLPWLTTPSDVFWQKNILNMYDDPVNASSLGPVNGITIAALAGLYVACFFAISYGKKFLTKITWITVVSPLVIMTILVFRCVALPGASDGIAFYIGKFEMKALGDINLWATAAGQILFSLSPGLGCAITLSAGSHNEKKDEDAYKKAMIIAIANSCFSLFGGFATFSILGKIALETNTPVAVVASKSGTGLAFITLANGMGYFGGASNVMSVLLFSMLVLLGIDSTFAMLETLIEVVKYVFKKQFQYQPSMPVMVAIMCSVCFLSGIIFTTRLGIELLDVVDHFIGTYVLLFANGYMGLIFNMDVGYENWAKALKDSTRGNHATPDGRDVWPATFWKWTMSVTAPMLPSVLLVFGLIADFKERYALNYAPESLVIVGYVLLFINLMPPVYTLLFHKGVGTLLKKNIEVTNTENINPINIELSNIT